MPNLSEHNVLIDAETLKSESKNTLLSAGKTCYPQTYTPTVLWPIARKRYDQHSAGYDRWRHYEVSWLEPNGKPTALIAEINISADCPYIIESKSMKLYFNSLNQHVFRNLSEAKQIIIRDLSQAVSGPVSINFLPINHFHDSSLYDALPKPTVMLDAINIDGNLNALNNADAHLLYHQDDTIVSTTYLISHLFKSNCPVTNQPDWASILIGYEGQQWSYESVLHYLVSYRNHGDFHEHCVETILHDLIKQLRPTQCLVAAWFTRRGGLEINPVRSTDPQWACSINNIRFNRQ